MKKIISLFLVAAMMLSVLPMAIFAEGNSGDIVLPSDCFHSSLSYTNNGDDHTVYCSDCGSTLTTEAHNFVDGTCVCGYKEVVDYTDPDLTITSTNLSMQAYIGAQFEVNTTAASKYDSVYVVVTQSRPTGDVEYTLTENIAAAYGAFAYEHKLAAAMMTDNITATVYGVKDGNVYTGSTISGWTVKQAAIDRLDANYKYVAKYPQYRALCVMLVDMLNYGTEAQTTFSYATDRLANAGLDAKYVALATATNPTIADTSATSSTGATNVTVYSVGLGVEASVQLQITFKLPSKTSYSNYEVHYSIEGHDYVVDGSKLEGAGTTSYVGLLINEVASAWMRSPITITVYNKTTGQPASATFTYSVESAASSRVSSALGNLINAMMKFGDSADTYFNHKY